MLLGLVFPPKSAGPGERANGVGDVGESKEDKFAGPEMLLVKDEGVKENGERLLEDLVRLSTLSKRYSSSAPVPFSFRSESLNKRETGLTLTFYPASKPHFHPHSHPPLSSPQLQHQHSSPY